MKRWIWPLALAAMLTGGSAGASFDLQIEGGDHLTIEADVVLPLREVAEALGYTVSWENGETYVENDNTVLIVVIGDTHYPMTREGADGRILDLSMDLPAPYLRNNETYVPAALFTYLLQDGQHMTTTGSAYVIGGEGVVDDPDEVDWGDSATTTAAEDTDTEEDLVDEEVYDDVYDDEESVDVEEDSDVYEDEAPAPEVRREAARPSVSATRAGAARTESQFQSYSTLREATSAAGVSLTLPSMGAQYDSAAYRAIPGEVVEVIYGSGGREALRLRKGADRRDVSGDYSSYETVKTIEVDGINVRMKGSGNRMRLATWERDGHAYSAQAAVPLTIADMMAIVRETT